MNWIEVVLIVSTTAFIACSMDSFTTAFTEIESKGVFNGSRSQQFDTLWNYSNSEGMEYHLRELEQKLNQILCNLNVQSIQLRYDDALKSSIVDRITRQMWQKCSKATPVIISR